MKVEKCPLCGKEPICSTFRATDDWFLHEIICFGKRSERIHHYEHSRSKIIVAIKWNRWARRERRKGAGAVSERNYKTISAEEIETKLRLAIIEQIPTTRLREIASAEREELNYILPNCKTCANKGDNRTCALCVGKTVDYQSSFYEPLAATEPKGGLDGK